MSSVWTLRLIAIVVLFTALGQASAQEVTLPNGKGLFEPIPDETRPVFIARLRSVVGFQGTHDWQQLYELLAQPDPKLKAEFVAKFRKFDHAEASYVLEFQPDHLMRLPEVLQEKYQWILSGCAKYRVGRKIEYHHSSMYALFRDGTWYFSQVMINIRCGPNDPDPCQRQNSNARK
jgi:hypothetical protein